MKFEVVICERLKRKVLVEADNFEDAEEVVANKWHSGEYVLNADDFADVCFEVEDTELNREV